MKVTIDADDDTVTVTVDAGDGGAKFIFEAPGMLTGCDLRDVLDACGIETEYTYDEEPRIRP